MRMNFRPAMFRGIIFQGGYTNPMELWMALHWEPDLKFLLWFPINSTTSSKALSLYWSPLSIFSRIMNAIDTFLDNWSTWCAVWISLTKDIVDKAKLEITPINSHLDLLWDKVALCKASINKSCWEGQSVTPEKLWATSWEWYSSENSKAGSNFRYWMWNGSKLPQRQKKNL